MKRICSQGLIRGWTAWQEQWETAARQKRMLAAAAARLARPALAAAVAHWRGEWEAALTLTLTQTVAKNPNPNPNPNPDPNQLSGRRR